MTEAPCKKDGKSHCPMAEFTLINRRKNLIFLQSPLIMAVPLSILPPKNDTLQVCPGQDGHPEDVQAACYGLNQRLHVNLARSCP
jgi:hypothetical protein